MKFEMNTVEGAQKTTVFDRFRKELQAAVSAGQEFFNAMALTDMSPAVQRNHQQTMR